MRPALALPFLSSLATRLRGFGERWAVGGLLLAAAFLAAGPLLTDSITYDETSHLTAGFSYLRTGDFRLAPDHPPLAKYWAAAPLFLAGTEWIPGENYGWRSGDPFLAGREFLFRANDGERLVRLGRTMIVLLLLATNLTTYLLARRLFGARGALLALVLATFSPTLLAHGHLVTTDLVIALFSALALLTFARVLERPSAARFATAAGALGGASLAKFTWPLVLPALTVMAVLAALRRPGHATSRKRQKAGEAPGGVAARRGHARVPGLLAVCLGLVFTTWLAIWAGYGFRSEVATDYPELLVARMAPVWQSTVARPEHPQAGAFPAILRWIADRGLLPDSYIYGLALTRYALDDRITYFNGHISTGGSPLYFPLAFLIKTPVPTLLLFLTGFAALLWRRFRSGDAILLAGLGAFALIYFLAVSRSGFNIGQRHLLPIYPVVFAIAGCTAARVTGPATPLSGRVPEGRRIARWLAGAAIAWLIVAILGIHPHYLSYFNELVGGPSRGHLYLADSNIDWGQDLKRLARYMHERPDEVARLSYFGSADPAHYGFAHELLPSSFDAGTTAPLDGGGLYVISVTNLLGLYDEFVRAETWQDPRVQQTYRHLYAAFGPGAANADPKRAADTVLDWQPGERERLVRKYERLRWGRFLDNLRRRPPDERVGYSLWVYQLNAAEVERLTQP